MAVTSKKKLKEDATTAAEPKQICAPTASSLALLGQGGKEEDEKEIHDTFREVFSFKRRLESSGAKKGKQGGGGEEEEDGCSSVAESEGSSVSVWSEVSCVSSTTGTRTKKRVKKRRKRGRIIASRYMQQAAAVAATPSSSTARQRTVVRGVKITTPMTTPESNRRGRTSTTTTTRTRTTTTRRDQHPGSGSSATTANNSATPLKTAAARLIQGGGSSGKRVGGVDNSNPKRQSGVSTYSTLSRGSYTSSTVARSNAVISTSTQKKAAPGTIPRRPRFSTGSSTTSSMAGRDRALPGSVQGSPSGGGNNGTAHKKRPEASTVVIKGRGGGAVGKRTGGRGEGVGGAGAADGNNNNGNENGNNSQQLLTNSKEWHVVQTRLLQAIFLASKSECAWQGQQKEAGEAFIRAVNSIRDKQERVDELECLVQLEHCYEDIDGSIQAQEQDKQVLALIFGDSGGTDSDGNGANGGKGSVLDEFIENHNDLCEGLEKTINRLRCVGIDEGDFTQRNSLHHQQQHRQGTMQQEKILQDSLKVLNKYERVKQPVEKPDDTRVMMDRVKEIQQCLDVLKDTFCENSDIVANQLVGERMPQLWRNNVVNHSNDIMC
eukprot:Nk52_evm5s526 gene=Nk52_evmTU5s526